jgi:formate dehydrogenase alpha subunit
MILVILQLAKEPQEIHTGKPMITLTIDGQLQSVPEGSTVLEAARIAGIEIPTLCHIDGLEPYGGCRLCLVEVEGSRTGAVTACTMPATAGMVVRSDTKEIGDLRRTVLEMILAEHPADCFNCRKSGDCKLHEYATRYGVEKVVTGLERNGFPVDDSNPFFILDGNRCILCGKCVRVCNEIQCSDVYDMAGRGAGTVVSPGFADPLIQSPCVSCGSCVAVCPTGALRAKDANWLGALYVERKVRTTCSYCGVGCEMELLVSKGRIVGVEPADGPSNHGRLCVKGRFAYNFVNNPDRLKVPLIRKDGKLVEASWEEALDLVTARIKETTARLGPEGIAGMSSARCTNEENYLFQKLMRAGVGTNNVDHCARLCHASSVTGLAATLGSGAMTNSIDEIDLQDAIFVTGSNTTETHPVIGTRIKRVVRKGARLIVADPRRIELANEAEVYLPMKPGTNVALYSAMAHVILEEGLEDRAFIEERTEGFEAWKDALAPYTPEAAGLICGVDPEDIRKAARIYATAKAAGIYYAMGVTQHASGTEGVMSLSNLALSSGKLGKPGCGVNPLRGQNNVQGACDAGALPDVLPGYRKVTDIAARAAAAAVWGRDVPAGPGLTVTEMVSGALDGSVGVLYIVGENPMVSDPDLGHVAEALDAVDFLVVQDIFLTETAAKADVVLPAACFAEKDGTFTNTERRVQRVRKAVEAPGKAREDKDIFIDLLERLGVPTEDPSASGVFDELASLAPQYAGMSYRRIDKVGIQWPCPAKDHPGTPILHTRNFTRGLGAFIPLKWRAPAEGPTSDYPWILTTGRNLYQYHTRTMTGREEGLTRLAGTSYVEIHPDSAASLGIMDGETVRLSSRRGAIQLSARLTDTARKDTVFVPFHYAEAAANVLTDTVLDPKAKIPELKVCAVRVEKV